VLEPDQALAIIDDVVEGTNVIARKQMTPPDERAELLDHLDGCRDLLAIMRDPEARKTIADLIAYLGTKLAEMGAQ
jgi:hypothetical protein